MAIIHPFRALRPRPADAATIASVPYDVVSTEEARGLAAGNALSFLRVSRAEIDLPSSTDGYSDAVYDRAAQNFTGLIKNGSLVVEPAAGLFLYRLRSGGHEQTGLGACFSLDEYDANVIRKHESTRPDKEDDRTRHMLAVRAQTGPVFLTYCASREVDALVDRLTISEPLFDFAAADGVRHTVWRVGGPRDHGALVAAFSRLTALYIADGHHRAASAARARAELRRQGGGVSLDDGADYNTVLAVAFPHDQVRILPYNRVVRDLGGRAPDQFLSDVAERFTLAPGPATPFRRGDIAMYFQGVWQTLRSRVAPDPGDAIASLDVSVLQDQLLAPVLGIAEARSDKRIDFVGGGRGTDELERLVDAGAADVAFSLFPVSVVDLMKVSDAGEMMPPKSTWFEPKLRDGLLIHLI